MQKIFLISLVILLLCFSHTAHAQIRDDVKARMEKDEKFYWVPEGPNVTELEYAGEFIHPDETVRPGNAGITRLVGDTVYVHDVDTGYILKYDLDGHYRGRIECEPIKSTFSVDLAIDEKERFVFIVYNENPWDVAYFFNGKQLSVEYKREFDLASVTIIGDEVFATTWDRTKARKYLVSRYDFSGNHKGWVGKNDKLFPALWMNSNRITSHDSMLIIASAHLPDVTFLNVETGEQETITFTIEQFLNRARSNASRYNNYVRRVKILGMYFDSFFISAKWFDDRLYLGTASRSEAEDINCWVIISLSADRTNVHYYRFIFSWHELVAKIGWHPAILKRNGKVHFLVPMCAGKWQKGKKFTLGLLGPAKEEFH